MTSSIFDWRGWLPPTKQAMMVMILKSLLESSAKLMRRMRMKEMRYARNARMMNACVASSSDSLLSLLVAGTL